MIEDALRQTGITAIGDVPWGTHFCQFYKTKQDLLDLLVPYFTEGLTHNEFCMWVTSEPIEAAEAKAALRQTLPDLDRRLAAGQLEIISYADWYRLGGVFDADRVLNGWVDRLNQARGKGFEGLRLSGNTFWLESKEWAAFTDYEERVNRVIGRYRMMALCTYSLDKCGASEVIDVVSNHRFALIKRHGHWARIQSAEQQRVEEELRESEDRFRTLTESLPQLVWTCLPDGRCDYLSRQWIEYTGIPEAAQLGYGWIEQVHPGDRRHVQEVWAAAVRDGTLFDVEFRIRRADGQYRWFKTRAVPLSDQAGCIVKWFGSNTDIDELRRAEAEIRQQAETLESRVRERTAALSDAKEWFQALVETASDWIWEIDRNGTYTYASPRVKDILGYEPEALIGKTPFALMPSDESERVAAQFRAVLEAQVPFAGLENTNLHMSGRRVVLETSGVPFFDDEGRLLGYRGVDRDITARKQAEEAVQSARDFYLKLLDEFPTPVWRAGLDAKCDWFNKTWLAFTGRTMAQELGDGWAEGVHPDDRERCVADYLRAFEAREPFAMEYRLRRHDGAYRWIMDVGRPFNDLRGNFAGYVGSCYDFTERKVAEEELKNIEWLLTKKLSTEEYGPPYGNLLELNTSGEILKSVGEATLVSIVGSYLDLLGTSSAVYEKNGDYACGIFSSGWCRFMDQASRALCGTDDNRAALDSGKWLCHESCWNDASKVSMDTDRENDIPCKGGIRLYAVPIRAGDEVIGSLNFGYGPPPQDPQKLWELAEAYRVSPEQLRQLSGSYESTPPFILELAKKNARAAARLIGDMVLRKRAEEELSRSREMLRLIVDNIPEYVFWKDRGLRYLGCNRVFAESAGVDEPAAVVGKDDFDLAWKETAELYRADDRSVMDTGTPKLNFEEPQTRPDGSLLWLRTSKVPLTDREGTVFGVLGIYSDITERKAMEAQTRRIEHMAAMGQLVSGLAHELRNPLFVLTGYLQLCREKLLQREYAALPDDLAKIEAAAARMKRITERFLALARPYQAKHERCTVQTVLTNTLEVLGNELMKNQIRVETAIAPELPPVLADPKQLQELFLNLIMNAMQAMVAAHGKGTLTVSAMLVPDTEAAAEGGWIEVRFQDNGPGIAPEHRAKLFEPFFSTKTPEQGTGLGLWTVRMTVMTLKGTVTCESEVGQGTTFIVRLPVVAEPSADPQAPENGHDREDCP